ncbi:MAG: diaminopimelate epimerase [Desulfobulbaceae bacterium]|nr:diaminopimelate epimerase [Desulfobulbaceae bacterium]
MTTIPFYKYTSLGNNFVIIDETNGTVLSEGAKSEFAFYATSRSYGVGSDNFLVIQKCSRELLMDIGHDRGYWGTTPDTADAEYIFRMFEPDGTEALSCGNGLMCITYHLSLHYGVTNAKILTELPTGKPRLVYLGTQSSTQYCWANLGDPRLMPPQLAQMPPNTIYDGVVSIIDNMEIQFRKHDLTPISEEQSLRISAYMVFTGEPHLVIFPETGFSIKGLEESIFPAVTSTLMATGSGEKRVAFGSWLLNHIGIYINKNYAHIFPSGISVNVVRKSRTSNVLEYRCFERGINRETSACGTGAMAASFVARQLGFIDTGTITVLPICSRWNEPDAQLLVEQVDTGWLLHGKPRILVRGEFYFTGKSAKTQSNVRTTSPRDVVDDRPVTLEARG